MTGSPLVLARLAALLPDVPRFVETRWMLLEGRCELLGLEEGAEGPSSVTRDGEGLVCVVGEPASSAEVRGLREVGNGRE